MSCGCQGQTFRWLGMEWLGLPMPVRVGTWIWFAFTGETADTLETWIARYPQCGCIARLKALFGG